MSSQHEIARPYAKAAFEYAKGHDLKNWLEVLFILSNIASQPKIIQLLKNPLHTQDECAALFAQIAEGYLNKEQNNFVKILAENHRLLILPQIYEQFLKFYDEHFKQVEVEVITTVPLSKEQQQRLTQSLMKRLKATVVLHEKINPALLGGAMIRMGDRIIDGSLIGRLTRLANNLNVEVPANIT